MQAASATVSVPRQRTVPQRFTRPVFALLTTTAISHTLVSPELQQFPAAFATAR